MWLQLKAEKTSSDPRCLQGNKTTNIEERVLTFSPSGASEPEHRSASITLADERCKSMSTTHFPAKVGGCGGLNLNVPVVESVGKRKTVNQSDDDLTMLTDDSQSSCKKQKKITDTDEVMAINRDLNVSACDEKCDITSECLDDSVEHTFNKSMLSGSTCHDEHGLVGDEPKDGMAFAEFNESSNFMNEHVEGMQILSEWKPLEKELYLKGVEMFGRNRCVAFSIVLHSYSIKHYDRIMLIYCVMMSVLVWGVCPYVGFMSLHPKTMPSLFDLYCMYST